MPLRGVKPTRIQKRLKVFLYGPPTSGKTTAAIQFPRPYLIDCERGAENDAYVALLNASNGAYFPTTDFDDMVAEVTCSWPANSDREQEPPNTSTDNADSLAGPTLSLLSCFLKRRIR